MARRQNHKLSAKAAEKEIFTLPNQITKPIQGLENEAQDFINTLLFGYRFGNHIFDTQTPHHEDWIMLFVILTNEAEGRATVNKNIVEITGRPMARCAPLCSGLRNLDISSPISALAARSYMCRRRR